MGGKRKGEDSEEEIMNKIRKLKSKLLQRSRHRSRIIYSSDSEIDDDVFVEFEAQDQRSALLRDHVDSPPRAVSPPLTQTPYLQQQSSRQPSTQQELPRPASPRPGPSSAPDEAGTLPQVQSSSSEDPELDNDVLLMLGDAPKPETLLGNSIHKDVASRWQEILQKGLQKEVKEKLLQEYLVPSNCNLLIAPTLNPEAKVALTDIFVKRDQAIAQRQSQLGVALAALAQAVDLLVKQDSSSQKALKPISDACRILCDSHYLETKTRRYFVLSAINSDLKDTLSDTIRNAFLFGDNVSDKLKAAQSIQKSGDTLKNTPRQFKNRFNKNNFILNKPKSQKNNLNFKPLHRRTQSKPDAGQYRPPPRASRPSSDRRRPSSPPRRYRNYRK